jgi:hypothetical protein
MEMFFSKISSLIFIFVSKGSKDTIIAKGMQSGPHHFDAVPAPGKNNDAV